LNNDQEVRAVFRQLFHIDGITNQSIDEETLLSYQVTGTNWPPATLVFSLESGAPEGASISTNGVFTWTPTERQGPSTNVITVKVIDRDYPILSTTNSFIVIVNEVNQPPVLLAPSDQTLATLATLTVTNLATDSDWPANTLTFALVSAPVGVQLGADTGVLTWTPSEVQRGSTNTIVVKVTDDGQPPLSATNEFRVVVKALPAPAPNIVGVSRDSAGLVTLRWQSVAGRRYRVETSDRLAEASWVELREIQAADVLSEITDSTVGLTERYYRIGLIP
jgi:Putative Ig domain